MNLDLYMKAILTVLGVFAAYVLAVQVLVEIVTH